MAKKTASVSPNRRAQQQTKMLLTGNLGNKKLNSSNLAAIAADRRISLNSDLLAVGKQKEGLH